MTVVFPSAVQLTLAGIPEVLKTVTGTLLISSYLDYFLVK
jgi:hypothetical protein